MRACTHTHTLVVNKKEKKKYCEKLNKSQKASLDNLLLVMNII